MTTKPDPQPLSSAEFDEGDAAADRFRSNLTRMLSVPKDELAKREAAYQKSRRARKTRTARAR